MQCPVKLDPYIEYNTGRWERQKLGPGRLATGRKVTAVVCAPPVEDAPVRNTLSHAQRNGQVVRGHAWGFDVVDPVKFLNGSLRLG
jgi:hypothetical protein